MVEKSQRPCLLGLDPGLAITGYAVISVPPGQPKLIEAGILKAPRHHSIEKRLNELYQGLSEILESHSVQSMAIEQLYSHYERPRTAILMGHARGVFCLAAAQHNLEVHSYAATKVKKMLTGAGRAPKSQMQRAVQLQLNLPKVPEPPDVADAIAVALCHYFSMQSMVKR
jgi:crossover junction endodeoxyribonuclease RuvC